MTPHSSRLLRQILVAVFLVTSLLLLTIFNATKPRILVLHSLSQASSWTSAMDAGFNKVLASNRMPVSVTRDYLNLDILADGVDTQVLTAAVGRKIEQFDPHVLIAVDDETSELVARHYVGRRDMKILYTGLMDEPESYGYTASSGVWGIREQLPLQAMNRLLEQMHPTKSLNIAVVGVDDLTGRAEMEQVLRYDWGHHRIKAQALVGNFEAWRAFVSGPARGADILLVLTTDKIPAVPGSRRMAPEADVNAWTEQHAVPLPMGVRASYVRFGGGLAVSSSPTELGAKAMEMALRQLANPEQRPSASSQVNSSYDISIRRSAWVRRGFKPPEIYLEAARAAGQLYP
ncbi:hypothetical protein [Limnohabitans sp.]|uniref:hypothetical protein n=1 Tax=Limnohabitans sp. TaxID=1907725 RepID=UPI002AFEEF2F|nr:hypothetical protein [Limnohabitans sp.]